MKTAKCKAFTIVELVIVIGVLAILAAVLIPTFSNLIRRANVAKDEQLVRNLNTAIAVESLTGNVRLTAFSAFDAAERCGYDKENIVSSASGNVILWDSVNNVFCYYESTADEYVYVPEDGAHTPPSSIKAYQYWKFYSSDEPIPDSQTYSVCLADGYTLDVPASFNVGVDAGNNAGIDVNYVGSTAPQTVYIRTNGGALTVSAPLDTVYHYGIAEGVVVNDVATDCYHENGTVFRLKYADNNGKIVLDGDAVVYCYMNASADGGADAESARSGGAVVYSSASGGSVAVSEGHTHGDFDEIRTVNGIYLVCKYCGGYTKFSPNADISGVDMNAVALIDAIDASTSSAPAPVTVTGITVDDTLSLAVGASSTLTASVSPSGAGTPLSWHSSDDSVATVDQSGKVTGVSSGTATITVSTAVGGKSATCAVSVGVVRIGSTAIYPSLEAAISASQNGDVITLLADATLNSAVNIVNKSITIDGGSHTLTVDPSLANANFITVAFGGADSCVIFKDIAVNANGGKIGLNVTESDAENQYSLVVTKGTVSLSNIVTDVLYSGSHTAKYRALRVDNGETTLGDGASLVSSTSRAGICETGGGAYVSSGATLIVGSGSSISGFKAASGGGVYNLGTLTLSGGVISGNESTGRGGGIANCGGTVTVNSGEICGNTAAISGGGISNEENGTITLNGGKIGKSGSGNSTSNWGGGIYVNFGTLNIHAGAEISYNSASGGTEKVGGGVALYRGTVNMDGGSISSNEASSGGGVYVGAGSNESETSAFNLSGGTVGSNTATYGGGLYVQGAYSALNITGGSVTENAATSGGGILVNAATLTISGGSISYNSAKNSSGNYTPSNKGGGVYVSSGTLTMTGGEVSYNAAYGGGGMYIVGASSSNKATVTISGGNIEHNTASQNGGAFNVNENATLYLSGCTVSANNADNKGKTWRKNNGTVYLNNVQSAYTDYDSAIN